jgi:hypothetical protein
MKIQMKSQMKIGVDHMQLTKVHCRSLTVACGAFLASLLAPATVSAEMITYSDSISMTTTSWVDSVDIPLFDPSMGILKSIDFTLQGQIFGDAAYESLDAGPSMVTIVFSGEIVLTRPDLSEIVVTQPLLNIMEPATAYDGTTDFMGTSGSTFGMLFDQETETVTSPPPMSDLALFTGVGTINLPVTADGMSFILGPGNVVAQFMQSAAAEVEVTYHYNVIPAPGAALLGVLGFGGIGWAKRRLF